MLRSRVLFLYSIATMAVGFIGVATADSTCLGDIRNEHRPSEGNYYFVTTSRVYRDAGVHVYETCVENPTDRDLDFDWYIPGPHSWILAHDALKSPRRRVTRDTLDGAAGCLRYGSLWNPDKADFLPHVSDRAEIDAEGQIGCDAMVGQGGVTAPTTGSSGLVDKIFEFVERLDVFAPADPKEPHETMVHIRAEIEIVPNGDASVFEHRLRYSAVPAYPNDFKASLEDLVIIPESDSVRALYAKQVSDGILRLGKDGAIDITLQSPKSPRIGEIRYRVLTKQNEHVATVFVPFWLESVQ